MPKRYRREIREKVRKEIRGGRRVSEVAKEHGINEMTVRSWVERDTSSGAADVLEMSRLRRENEVLYRIVGQLTFDSATQKKNLRRERC